MPKTYDPGSPTAVAAALQAAEASAPEQRRPVASTDIFASDDEFDEWDEPVSLAITTDATTDATTSSPQSAGPSGSAMVVDDAGEEGGDETSSFVWVNGRAIKMRRADCTRASREGRPSEPSARAMAVCRELVRLREATLRNAGRTKLTSNDYTKLPFTFSSSGKGATVKTQTPANQAKVNHLATLKSRNVETYNTEACYLLCDKTADQQYDRLAESALRANAGNQAVTKRKTTQGASNQTPRINSKTIGQAAAPQCVNAALAMALAEDMIQATGVAIRNPLGVVTVDPAMLLKNMDLIPNNNDFFIPVVSTSELIYNACPTKLGIGCIRTVAQKLAKREQESYAISERMASANYMLSAICRSIGGGYEIDSTWAAIVLVVYLSCDPRGRPLLAESGLTDLDLQTAYVLESYGRSEITRRARLAETQAQAQSDGPAKKRPRKGKGKAVVEPEPEGVDEDIGDVLSPHSSLTTDDRVALATKKRRATRGLASASCSDAHGVIDYWFRALRSEESSVLETLLASSRDAAREASKATLERQSDGNADVASNRTLNHMSAKNAVKSVEELVKFVHRAPRDIPAIVAMSTKWGQIALGLVHSAQPATKTVLHACRVLDRALLPHNGTKLLVLHSSALQEMAPRGTDTQIVPGIAERYACLSELKAVDKAPPSKGDTRSTGKQVQVQFMGNGHKTLSFQGKRAISGIERYISEEANAPILSSAGGITRSIVALHLTMPVNHSTFESAKLLRDEGLELHASVTKTAASSSSRDTPVCMLGSSRKPEMRAEPLCTPCSRLGVGIRVNEFLRRWMAGRTRKNYPAMVLCGLRTNAEVSKDQPLIIDTEPLPLTIITNFSLKALPGVSAQVADCALKRGGVAHVTMGASVHICIDGAVRVPELLPKIDNLFQRRALLYVAASQASYIADVGSAISATAANCSSANSKKISCADVTTLLLTSHFDTYVGGLVNVQRSFANTPYTGTVGPRVDTGATPPGLFANYYKADHRGHGSISLGQEAADEICRIMTNSHHVEVGKNQYVLAPVQTRGIPHGFIPDVHSVLNDYSASLETVRKITNRTLESTLDAVQVLPFSWATQSLAPDVEGTVDSTLRHAFRDSTQTSTTTGRSYLPDSTSEEAAIFVEPLWRRPCQASVGDNPFATAYDHIEGMFNAVNTIAGIATDIGSRAGMETPSGMLSTLHEFICTTVFSEEPPAPTSPSYLWATDFLFLLFGTIYPYKHAVDELTVPPSIAKLSAAMARCCKHQDSRGLPAVGAPIFTLLNDEELADVRRLWAKFSTRPDETCAWKNGLKRLLELLIQNNGSHDVPLESIQEFRSAVDSIPRSAFFVYSDDGKAPPEDKNPLSDCTGPQDVRRPHVDPVFVATGALLEIEPRGALVGLKPFQLRQGYAMLLGAHMDDVVPQIVRNEGGLSLRLSSAADLLEATGAERTDKACAPLQTEADNAAFGNRDAKLLGCALQRSAWDRNAVALAPLFAALNPPQDSEKRARGEWGDASWVKERVIEERKNFRTLDVESIARNQLEQSGKCVLESLQWAL